MLWQPGWAYARSASGVRQGPAAIRLRVSPRLQRLRGLRHWQRSVMGALGRSRRMHMSSLGRSASR